MSFIVIPSDTALFRVNIKDISCDLSKPNANHSSHVVTGNFDMFRTFSSGASSSRNCKQPVWKDFEVLFLYQTEMPEMLVAKRFTMTVSCTDDAASDSQMKDHFVGEAVVDLLTLAAGPTVVTLALLEGDTAVGRLYMTVVMEEVTEMKATTSSLKLTVPPTCPYDDINAFTVSVLKNGIDGDVLEAEATVVKTADGGQEMSLTVTPHLFAMTFPGLCESGGFTFEFSEKGFCGKDIVATALIRFFDRDRPTYQLVQDEAETGAVFTFTDELKAGNDYIGVLEGEVRLEHMPRFSQMHQGTTVDGVVCFGVPYKFAKIMPPFISKEHAGAEDAIV